MLKENKSYVIYTKHKTPTNLVPVWSEQPQQNCRNRHNFIFDVAKSESSARAFFSFEFYLLLLKKNPDGL